jgi:glutathione synthetase-like protein/uncharacterized protein DUF1704
VIQRKINRAPPDPSSALAVDARLTEIERELNLLLHVTPTNGAKAWTDFERSGFESVPTLQSRPLDFDPDLVKRDLYNVEIEWVEDPALNSLFRAKRDEIARQITMLQDRGTSRFGYGALQLYGEPGDSLKEDVRKFISSVGRSIIKPLCGAKGRNVFVVDGDDEPNLNQIMEAVLGDGYIYLQGYVDGAEEGDMRIFLLDGELIEVDGHISAFRRVPDGSDPRANISTGGRMRPADITETTRAVVDAMRDKLVQDGMFFVGIDLIGDKVVEINAESPGGLQAIERLYEVDICPIVIDALERRTRNPRGTRTANV